MQASRIVAVAAMVLAACARTDAVDTAPVSSLKAAKDTAALPLTELSWIAPSADPFDVLAGEPDECLREPGDQETAYLIAVGRTAFRSPLLFGGQAARGGLSCNSCHRGGHDNPAFFLKGLSGAPGTADVTSAIFSKVREDGVFNPVPIPSLVDIAEKKTFGTMAPAPSIHDFITTAVHDEFQGAAATPVVIAGLTEYVKNLAGDACVEKTAAPSLDDDVERIDMALETAVIALGRSDSATADFLIVSAQNALGRIHERYAGEDLGEARRHVESFARSLGALRFAIKESPATASSSIAEAREGLEVLRKDLLKQEANSLYGLTALDKALNPQD